jgi:hypothetical protein
MWIYKFVNLPTLPHHIENAVLSLYESPELEERLINVANYPDTMRPELANKLHPKDAVATRNGKKIKNNRGFRYRLNDSEYEWIHQNISDQYTDCGLNVCTGSDGTLLPHTDLTRTYLLLYMFDAGGPDVETVYWKEEGKPLERGPREYGSDYNSLQVLNATQYPLRTWVLLNTTILHSVENMVKDRIQIQMGLNSIPESWTYSLTKEI